MRNRKKLTFEEAAPLRAKPYEHFAQYYETDQMRIIHHSNYVRWMEEARVDFMEQLGFGYEMMEAMGIYSPVLGVSAEYKEMVHFNERVRIECRIGEYTGLQLTILYRMTNLATGNVCTLGESRHCFLTKDGAILSLKRRCPEIHQHILDSMIQKEGEDA